jgi:RNA polymerase sigma factor (sigma-70 family)
MSRPFPHRPAPAPSVSDWLDASGRHQPLAERTVLELARRIQLWQTHPDGPDRAPCAVRRRALRARDQLVRHNLRLIGHTWARHRSSLPAEDEGTADAFQEAALSLIRAAEKFDPRRGYRFSTYASFWVRRGFSTHERRGKRMIRLPHDKAAVVLRAQRLAEQHQAACGHLPALEWLAGRCGPRGSAIPVQQLQELLDLWRRTGTSELDRPGPGQGQEAGPTLLEQIPGRRCPDIGAYDRSVSQADFPDGIATFFTCAADASDEQRALLPLLLTVLDPTERRLLWHLYLREHPLSPRQIQRVMGLDRETQQRLERGAIEKLREAARGAGAF